jgi:molecular chaperone HscB
MDPFALLGAPRRYDLDLPRLEKTHRELSRTLHPDKFAGASHSERRAALENAASVNEAFRILKDPIRRAEALFQLAGAPMGEEPKASPEFLMDMMEQREALAEARATRDLDRVRAIGATMEARARAVTEKLTQAFTSDPPDLSALPLLGELRFYARFRDEILAIEEEAEAVCEVAHGTPSRRSG